MSFFSKFLRSNPRVRNSLVVLPDWLRRDFELPPWARVRPSGDKFAIKIEVDTKRAYAEWQKLLGVSEDKFDQYWLEVMYQCVKMDLQYAIAGSSHDPRVAGKVAEFRFKRADDYALSKYKPGFGISAATRGIGRAASKKPAALSAREHYKRIRGRLPM